MSEEQNKEEQLPDTSSPLPETGNLPTGQAGREPETMPTQTLNPKLQTFDTMEVHHHGHVHHQKKWKEYLFQFLMLFLAVFCGFLAENQREHYIEHQREIKFINSLANDLKADTARLGYILKQRNYRVIMLDSFMTLLSRSDAGAFGRYLYYYNSLSTRGWSFRYTPVDGTMQQLKNAGNLRLIRKANVSDSIIAYDVDARALAWGSLDEEEMMDKYRDIAEGIFDGRILISMRDDENNLKMPGYDPPLRVNEDGLFRLNYRIHMLNAFNKTLRRDARSLLLKADGLLSLLKNEYHLK